MKTIEYTDYQPRGLSRELTPVPGVSGGKPLLFTGPTAFEVPEEITVKLQPDEDRCTFVFRYVDSETPKDGIFRYGEYYSLLLGAFTRKILQLTIENASRSLANVRLPEGIVETVTQGQPRQVEASFYHNFMIVNAILAGLPNAFKRELVEVLANKAAVPSANERLTDDVARPPDNEVFD